MLRLMLALVALFLSLEISPGSSAIARPRVRRGYNNGGYGGYGAGYGAGYGLGSDERDASVSNEGCNSGEETRSYGRRELPSMRNRSDRQKDRGQGSRSFAKASASASASSFSQNGKLRA